ncbi:Hypothetical protein ADU71_0269 [Pediococcus damnosus]|uniref:hypothetical protein n=2 Tax=Lactobacillaceae TaxID=33958 RepID=UPI00070977F1|nr:MULTISPECIES: hypothetical protein [Pediococcus]AMV59948.1 Hypothetical protein ADU69_0270 [Pediococcus damnosus]AMV64192.1 Hypothetical protein ADU71_0269 [Pediococcus damnosus]AVL00482.1 hypothetical protein PI20285_07425 [Pediococcus inopinatus]PIO80858.1 hypothetical protein BSQ38_03935 [Pediococcus damnosus]
MNIMKTIHSIFNLQTVLLVVGLLLIVVGLWLWLGYQIGLIVLGVAMVVIALLINYEKGG